MKKNNLLVSIQKRYLILFFLIISVNGLSCQETISEKQSKTISLNADCYRLVSFEEGNPLQFGISINNIINNRLRIELDYYYKSEINLEPYYQILDINISYKKRIPFLNVCPFYIIGGNFIRNTYLSGLPGRMNNIYSYQEKSIYKMGIGTSIGLGLNVRKNIFIESNFKIGYYILGENHQFYGREYSGFTDQDTNPFFAYDILKLVYKFGD